MNEQIQDLYDQAVTHASSELGIWQTRWTTDSPRFNYEKFLYKKFAELIVQECIDIAYKEGDNVPYLSLRLGVKE